MDEKTPHIERESALAAPLEPAWLDRAIADRAIADRAERQHGVIARRQLRELALSTATIERRLASGRLHRLHYGVYAVGHRALTPAGRWMGAVLAAGPGAVLSHRSAAALWGIRPTAGSRIDVMVPGSGRRNRPGIAVHVTRELDRDRTERAGIPITSIARTLLDLAEVVPEGQIARAFEQAERLQLLDLNAVEEVCRRCLGRRGLGALARVAADQSGPPAFTRSELERAFLDFCDEEWLPKPRVNQLICGLEVDMVWPTWRLVVELDGYAFHRTRAAFERDRARDVLLQGAGYRVLRFTDRRLRQEPEAIADTLRAFIRVDQRPEPCHGDD